MSAQRQCQRLLSTAALYCGIGLLWLLHLLPWPIVSALGEALGKVLYLFPTRRRRIAERNLELCFPDTSLAERNTWVQQHFAAYARAALEHALLLWGSKKRIHHYIQIEGLEHLLNVQNRPLIVFAPHFIGLDAGGIRLATEFPGTSMYARQSHPLLDALLRQGRERFGMTKLVLRTDGIRPLIRHIKSGLPAYYLPDMDLGPDGALFTPFFGIPAATIPALSRLVKLTGAIILPCITWQEPHGHYRIEFFPAWTDCTGNNPAAETQRMHAFLEEQIRKAPWQYLWTHQRFKTRPQGEKSVYES